MFVKHFLSLSKTPNLHYLTRYISFISSRSGHRIKHETHLHHILPKSKDFFPEFKNLKEHKWNGIHLTTREHFIAHRLLHKAYPGSCQTRAFYLMCNTLGFTNSRAYKEANDYHRNRIAEWHNDPIKSKERADKISSALKGKSKSAEHVAKLVGHVVSVETREKLRLANIGKVHSEESKEKMSKTRLGKKRGAHTEESKRNISLARKLQNRKWFNNGVESKQFAEPPDSTWVRGRLPWVK